MKHYKEWTQSILAVITLWMLGNAALTGSLLLLNGKFVGEDTFLLAFFISLAIELAVVVSAGIVGIAIFSLMKSILTSKHKK